VREIAAVVTSVAPSPFARVWLEYSERSITRATGHTPFGACQDPLPTWSRDLTTTCYAILCILALKSRTAYELAAKMQHCFEYFWPRADACVYEDATRPAKYGFVSVHKERVGKRPRTTYAITAEGQQALEEWLARPSQPVSLEFEGLLKVYLARFGSREQLLTSSEMSLDQHGWKPRESVPPGGKPRRAQ
jgi:DNA-binding PadR family transcriptional regulator